MQELANLALTEEDKYILMVVLAVVGLFVVYFEWRVLRQKTSTVRRASQRKDEAYNAILTVRSVTNVLQRQGTDVSAAQSLLRRAKDAMADNDYDAVMDYCDRARDELTRVRRSKPVSAALSEISEEGARSRLESVAEEVVETAHPTQIPADTYAGTKVSQEKSQNYLGAKFELNTAKSELSKAVLDGRDVEIPSRLVTQAEEEFESGNYSKALSLALRARKGLSEDAQKETIRLKHSDEGVEEVPSEEPLPEEDVRGPLGAPECSVCGTILDRDDVFCAKCGTKVPKERKCPQCGTKPKGQDKFCRKCGSKIP